MSELICQITEHITIKDTDFFLVIEKDSGNKHKIPVQQLEPYGVAIGEFHLFRKFQKPNLRTPILEYLSSAKTHPYYVTGKQYDFTITNIETATSNDSGFFYVEDIDKNIIKVRAFPWQILIWKESKLICKVQGISSNGIPVLKNHDFRHPIYEEGNHYNFKVLEALENTVNKNIYYIYKVYGEDGNTYQVNMTSNQKASSILPEIVSCQIVAISSTIKLIQSKEDGQFVEIESIVSEKTIINKYFKSIFKQKNDDPYFIQFIDQYKSRSAFWVFTYSNKILPKLTYQFINNRDFKSAKEVNELIILFEKWIISQGIIKSFPSEEERMNAKKKATTTLKSAKLKNIVLSVLSTNPFTFLSDDSLIQKGKVNGALFYYAIRFSDFKLIDETKVIEIIKTLKNENLDEEDIDYLKKLILCIRINKKVYISEEEKEYFSLSSPKISASKFTEFEEKYVKWTFSEILIAKLINDNGFANNLIGQLLKLFTKCVDTVQLKEKILYNAYKWLENYNNCDLNSPIFFSQGKVLLDNDLLFSDLTNSHESWLILQKAYINSELITVKLTSKNSTGFEVAFFDLIGYLPYHLIHNSVLKKFGQLECDFNLKVKVSALSKEFNFFIVEEIAESNSVVLNNFPIVEGGEYNAIIKDVQKFGFFVSTPIGDGLVHIQDIFDFGWNVAYISRCFKPKNQIRIILKDASNIDRLQFSFLSIKDVDLDYYNIYAERLLTSSYMGDIETPPNDFDILQDSSIIERAFCIEQYAVLQSNLHEKIINLQIAKQFFTKAKHARSFLLNIYISYFEVLIQINDTLKTNSLSKILSIRETAKQLKATINQKTIETFPDSEKLIFFLDIISLFNDKDDGSFETLFKYILKYSSSQKTLNTIAKITLANNLLISESKEDSNFSLKNLRLLNDYLSNGILSLEESIDDKHTRQIQEEILYWSEKIKNDEGEMLEFKSSLFTPILSEDSVRKLNMLKSIKPQTEAIKLEVSRVNGDLARKAVIHSAMKTLVAFANHKGGSLLIGVNDNKHVIGLEEEYQTFKKHDQNRDGFGKYFDELIRVYIGDSFSSLMNRKFLKFTQGDILIVTVEPSLNEIFLLKNEEGKGQEQLYIRNLSSSKELQGSQLAKFIKNRSVRDLNVNFEETII